MRLINQRFEDWLWVTHGQHGAGHTSLPVYFWRSEIFERQVLAAAETRLHEVVGLDTEEALQKSLQLRDEAKAIMAWVGGVGREWDWNVAFVEGWMTGSFPRLATLMSLPIHCMFLWWSCIEASSLLRTIEATWGYEISLRRFAKKSLHSAFYRFYWPKLKTQRAAKVGFLSSFLRGVWLVGHGGEGRRSGLALDHGTCLGSLRGRASLLSSLFLARQPWEELKIRNEKIHVDHAHGVGNWSF